MKYTGDKNKLLNTVGMASHLATTRATLPILQNVLLTATKDGLTVRATDLDQTIVARVEGEVKEVGSLTVPARLLVEYLTNNQDGSINLESNDTSLVVSSANHRATLKGMAAEEYPTMPEIKPQATLRLNANAIREAIQRTIFASATDETRPILNGLLWRFQGKELIVVGTDGYRLARYITDIPSEHTADYILPKRTLQELLKLLGEGEVELAFSANQVQFAMGEITLASRLLDGNFPAFEAIIPKKKEVETTLKAAVLAQSLKLASLFSRDSAYSTKMTLEGEKLEISAVSAQLGENTNQVKLDQAVLTPLTVSLNAQYLLDVLGTVSGEVKLGFIDAKSPVTVEAVGQDRYLYLLMPLRSE